MCACSSDSRGAHGSGSIFGSEAGFVSFGFSLAEERGSLDGAGLAGAISGLALGFAATSLDAREATPVSGDSRRATSYGGLLAIAEGEGWLAHERLKSTAAAVHITLCLQVTTTMRSTLARVSPVAPHRKTPNPLPLPLHAAPISPD